MSKTRKTYPGQEKYETVSVVAKGLFEEVGILWGIPEA